jgi:hypothetical protein
MLEGPGATDIPMTGGAPIRLDIAYESAIRVGIMTGKTAQRPFADGVMRRHLELRPDVLVALHTEIGRGVRVTDPGRRGKLAQISRGSLVGVVAIRADQPRIIVVAAHPIEMSREANGVAAEAIAARGKTDIRDLLGLRVDIPASVA